ncbi:putative plant self-incompatibility S1 family protein [Turnera subulata]|uniref:S-protein homolog n=1 Tax=Turnera subulata TaxID=218843 RepID=A0A516IJK6_9ROSI|nr:putative plant self-incompatibility S1 family protein [Turnera subulata]
MSPLATICLFSILSIIPFLASANTSINFEILRNKYEVHVINGFSSNAQPLLLRCWSKNDNLGNHTLYIGGDFNFRFGLRVIPPSSHFYCDFNHGANYLKEVSVFDEDEVLGLCSRTKTCYWRSQDDGLYFSNDNSSWKKLYMWN